MPLHSSRLARSASTPQRCLRWRHAAVRLYSASTNTPESASDPQWFRDLRREMLGRPLVSSAEFVNSDTDKKLELSLSSFLPPGWGRRKPHSRARLFVPLGHSLLWFNNSMPVDQLLPDGTDPLQSPGGPWARRMWAGGRMEVNRDDYYHRERGFTTDTDMVCAERITDVQLRGSGDAEKIFVTLERRFARGDTLDKAKKVNAPSQTAPPGSKHFFQEQLLLLRDDWGDAILKEERNLVFLKEKTPAELEAIKSGKFVPVRYLDRPSSPCPPVRLCANKLQRLESPTFRMPSHPPAPCCSAIPHSHSTRT
jgi:hydroxyacyl-ACP dehydratase HTD2-like protein with hotdog domain